jgi:hypothetical protein
MSLDAASERNEIDHCGADGSNASPSRRRERSTRRHVQKVGKPLRLVRIERRRGLRDTVSPDAEPDVLGIAQINRDAQPVISAYIERLEVFDDLEAKWRAAAWTEAEIATDLATASFTRPQRILLSSS